MTIDSERERRMYRERRMTPAAIAAYRATRDRLRARNPQPSPSTPAAADTIDGALLDHMPAADRERFLEIRAGMAARSGRPPPVLVSPYAGIVTGEDTRRAREAVLELGSGEAEHVDRQSYRIDAVRRMRPSVGDLRALASSHPHHRAMIERAIARRIGR